MVRIFLNGFSKEAVVNSNTRRFGVFGEIIGVKGSSSLSRGTRTGVLESTLLDPGKGLVEFSGNLVDEVIGGRG